MLSSLRISPVGKPSKGRGDLGAIETLLVGWLDGEGAKRGGAVVGGDDAPTHKVGRFFDEVSHVALSLKHELELRIACRIGTNRRTAQNRRSQGVVKLHDWHSRRGRLVCAWRRIHTPHFIGTVRYLCCIKIADVVPSHVPALHIRSSVSVLIDIGDHHPVCRVENGYSAVLEDFAVAMTEASTIAARRHGEISGRWINRNAIGNVQGI